MDKGTAGLKRTIEVLDGLGIDHTGTFKSQSDPRYLVKEIKGVRIGFVSFTYGTNSNVNGYAVNTDNDYVVNLTKKSDEPYKRQFWKQALISFFYRLPLSIQNVIHPLYPNHGYDDNVHKSEIGKDENIRYVKMMKDIIAKAKQESDLIVVCLHAGGQFNSEVGAYTGYLIDEIRSLSVDVLIVNHPHCVLGSQFKENRFEAWSLGNFCFTPDEGYFIDGVFGEFGIVVHLEIDKENKTIDDVYFSVVKNVKLADGSEQVAPISFIEKNLNKKDREELKDDTLNVIRRFVGHDIESFELQEEYKYADF